MNTDSCVLCDHNNLKLVVKSDWPLYKCQNCGLIQVSPIPSKSAVAALYQGNYWKNYGPYGSQEQAHKKYFEAKMELIKKIRKKGKLLDVGCALGTFMHVAKKQGFTVEGIDISDYAVGQCCKLGLAAKQGNSQDIHHKNYYDIVTAFEIIEHEVDPKKTVSDIWNCLKPGGLLLMTVPNTQTLTSFLMGQYWFGYKNREHLFHFNQKSLKLILEKARFNDITIDYDSPRPYLATYYLERINFYLFKSKLIEKLINLLKKIPGIKNWELNFNPWGNLVAQAKKPL